MEVATLPGVIDRADRFLDHYRGPRVLGLDLLRIGASLVIIAYHGSLQAQLYRRGPIRHGYLAVDVFFVLSGWLLTRQALRMREPRPSLLSYATGFWTRRWFRILPAYWVILVVIIAVGAVLPVRFGMGPADFVRHALFLQLVLRPNLLSVSWSLVGEEGFYLVLPFAIVLFALIGRRTIVVILMAVLLLVPLAIRVISLRYASADAILTLPWARFDGLVVGAALGAVWSLAPEWRSLLLRHRIWLFGVGGAGFLVLLLVARDGYLFWSAGLLAVTLSVGMMLPFLTGLSWPARVPALLPLGITVLSDLTYPLYLFHVLAYRLVDLLNIHSTIRYFLVAVPVIFAGALLLHVCVERPFLRLRGRLATPRLGSLAHSTTEAA